MKRTVSMEKWGQKWQKKVDIINGKPLSNFVCVYIFWPNGKDREIFPLLAHDFIKKLYLDIV